MTEAAAETQSLLFCWQSLCNAVIAWHNANPNAITMQSECDHNAIRM